MNTNNVVQVLSSPEQLQQQFDYWKLLLAPLGAAVWHGILKVYPWSQSQGGFIRGIGYFLWIPKGAKVTAPKISSTAPPLNP